MTTKIHQFKDFLAQEDKPNKKPIEFTQYMSEDGSEWMDTDLNPDDWDNVMILTNTSKGAVFLAWDNSDVEDRTIYRGLLNDGFVEEK